ncbi:hypothetical protein RhiJN_09866 [Ceratobasidium sp. AG-Ba]|nr:hypothetical protein RhiJN_09866 [Ceratobasidium sp. AG-Ba]
MTDLDSTDRDEHSGSPRDSAELRKVLFKAACKIVQLQINLRLMHLRDGVNAPQSDHQRGSDATAEPDTQPGDGGEEADIRSAIPDLIQAVDPDQDMPGEDEATTSVGEDTANSQSCTQR